MSGVQTCECGHVGWRHGPGGCLVFGCGCLRFRHATTQLGTALPGQGRAAQPKPVAGMGTR